MRPRELGTHMCAVLLLYSADLLQGVGYTVCVEGFLCV